MDATRKRFTLTVSVLPIIISIAPESTNIRLSPSKLSAVWMVKLVCREQRASVSHQTCVLPGNSTLYKLTISRQTSRRLPPNRCPRRRPAVLFDCLIDRPRAKHTKTSSDNRLMETVTSAAATNKRNKRNNSSNTRFDIAER